MEKASIYDLAGKLIRSIDLLATGNARPIDVSNLQSGSYIISIVAESGDVFSRRVTKE